MYACTSIVKRNPLLLLKQVTAVRESAKADLIKCNKSHLLHLTLETKFIVDVGRCQVAWKDGSIGKCEVIVRVGIVDAEKATGQ